MANNNTVLLLAMVQDTRSSSMNLFKGRLERLLSSRNVGWAFPGTDGLLKPLNLKTTVIYLTGLSPIFV